MVGHHTVTYHAPDGRQTNKEIQDSRLNNVMGYLKYDRHIWDDAVDDTVPEGGESESGPQSDNPEDIESISEDKLAEAG